MAFLSSNTSSYTVQLSNTVNCSICGQSMAKCSCVPVVGSAASQSLSAQITAGSGLSSSNTFYTTGTYLTCSLCGYNISVCQCSSQQTLPYIIPNVHPNVYTFPNCYSCGQPSGSCTCYYNGITITPGTSGWGGTSTTFTITNPKLMVNWKVSNVESTEEYESSGFFRIEESDPEKGILGQTDLLYLPEAFKNVFYQVRDGVGTRDLWQLLCPLVIRIDTEEDGNKESHFYSVYGFERAEWKEADKKVCIVNAKVQEIVSTLELMKLNEIQRVFTKLLRRM